MKKLKEIVLEPSDGVQGCKVVVYDLSPEHTQLFKVQLVSQSTDELLDEAYIPRRQLERWCDERKEW